MKRKNVIVLLSLFLIVIFIAACSNSSEQNDAEQEDEVTDNDDTSEVETNDASETEESNTHEEEAEPIDITLTELLPYKKGYVWNYDGAIEYGHEMELKTIEKSNEQSVYTVEGEVEDVSGGESGADYSLHVTYTVTEDSITQHVEGDMMMDNVLPELELIHAPLSEGTEWTQTQENTEGEEVTLESSIEAVENDGGQKIYTVVYEDSDSDYYEKRKIKEGIGVISFEHLYIYDEGSMPMGYELNYDFTGFSDD